MSFRIHALTPGPFRPLFDLDDDALIAIGARRMVCDAPHAAPCRVSLADAEPGDMAMRGAASELVLYFYERVPLDGLETTGDTAPMEQLAGWDPNA